MLSFKDLQTVDILFRLLYLRENKRFPYNKKKPFKTQPLCLVLIYSCGNFVKVCH